MSIQEKMTALADAVRSKTGGTDPLTLDEMTQQIAGLWVDGSMDTSNATASAGDIAKGKTAYGKNGLITGTVITYDAGGSMGVTASKVYAVNTKVALQYDTVSDQLLRKGSIIYMHTEASSFGTAEAADVAAGKTFTSAAGLQATGTGSIGATVSRLTVTQETQSLSVSFPGLNARPEMFAVFPLGNLIPEEGIGAVQSVVFDGTSISGSYGMNGQSFYSASGFSWSYADGVLTVTAKSETTGGYFPAGIPIQLVYAV